MNVWCDGQEAHGELAIKPVHNYAVKPGVGWKVAQGGKTYFVASIDPAGWLALKVAVEAKGGSK